MSVELQPGRRSRLLGALAPLAGAFLLRGFTVDDALITCRYAHNLATGAGYVFNKGGPSTDGVTPLGFAYLLAPFARTSALDALVAAKILGLLAHVVGSIFITRAVAARGSSWLRWSGPVVFWVSAPAAAWAVSGMETGLVAALFAIAASLRLEGKRERIALTLVGLAAGLRPETLPLAVVLGVPAATGPRDANPREVRADLDAGEVFAPRPRLLELAHGLRLLAVSAPFVAVATLRALVFGRPAPLSALAKPAEPSLGFVYAGACLLLTGFVLLAAPLAARRMARYAKWLLAALATHALAISLAGGDWMPLSRLFVAALPVLALAGAEVAEASHPSAAAARAALALAGELWAWWTTGEKAARVGRDREALIAELRGPLSEARVIASIDIGWVGAAAPDATIVDLAGVTDPEIARLPGRHIEKKIPDDLLEERGVDTLVLLLYKDQPLAEPWSRSTFGRGIEMYIATAPGLADRSEPERVTEGRLRYVLLRRKQRAAERPAE
ncbi:MAG: hypothetical protein U0271_25545 [Polyangiaceae bacterium]